MKLNSCWSLAIGIALSLSTLSAPLSARTAKAHKPTLHGPKTFPPYFGMMAFDGLVIDRPYPNDALSTGTGATLVLHTTVDKSGSVIGCKADDGPVSLVQAACAYAVAERYEPYWEIRMRDRSVAFIVDRDPTKIFTRPAKAISGSFAATDYPSSALRNGETGQSIAMLKISEAGSVDKCSAVGATDALNVRTCDVFMSGRFQFTPALDSLGHATPIEQPFRINWALPE